MPTLPLDRLLPHPGNANVMPADRFAALREHIRASGRYPPLIVRPHPSRTDHYELLDGHHRADALRALGCEHAACEVWDVDDAQARVLLLTLNRLQGEDDPRKRGSLLRELRATMDVDRLTSMLPDDRARIESLIALTEAAPKPTAPPRLNAMPEAVTFFLKPAQRRALLRKLRPIASDRSAALARLLRLDESAS